MVAIDRVHLMDAVLYLWILAFRPGRTRLVDAGSPTGHTKEVFISSRIIVSEIG
jgi:hypothetical protein